ncbi:MULTISPECIES: hypothetical protein [unclassified Caballeronia]|uniref:hypothetical protein n=1 Tax=unclassified Caballeronia TaxID=2646786 RepID=UPI00285E96A7|nr:MULTISPECIES: hypothetical protein [unclassified Caballeronia]MDR5736621.1 hypothetical protein [Caballeronia sp. LZ016]MDR5810899.1 hypothetical protein [Caballeronia sp. LZ019]
MSGDAPPESARSSQSAFDEWPPELRALFDGTLTGAPHGFTVSLCAVDGAGRIRTALLSAGELLAPDARTLCFGLWPSSRTAQAIASSARATATFVLDEAFYQVQLDTRRVALDGVPLACFVGSIESGEMQRVAYARLTGGITFELEDAGSVRARWREQIEWLTRAASAAA